MTVNHRHEASLARADDSAESANNGLNQLEVQGKNVLKVLSVELEGMNRINSLDSMNSRVQDQEPPRSQRLVFRLPRGLACPFPSTATRPFKIR